MTDIIKNHFPKQYNVYVQGFGGGASLLFSKNQEKCQIYNDLGKNVYSLFKTLSDKEMFLQLKQKLDLTYYSSDLRKQFKQKLKEDNLKLVLDSSKIFEILIQLLKLLGLKMICFLKYEKV